MTISELQREVLALLPDDCRVDVSLNLRRHAPGTHIHRTDEERAEIVVEVAVWYGGNYEDIDAPTYESALQKFKAVILPELGLEQVAPAAERLAELEAGTADVLLTE
jgi:hypothetical protein